MSVVDDRRHSHSLTSRVSSYYDRETFYFQENGCPQDGYGNKLSFGQTKFKFLLLCTLSLFFQGKSKY
jgi:hypothetical protein